MTKVAILKYPAAILVLQTEGIAIKSQKKNREKRRSRIRSCKTDFLLTFSSVQQSPLRFVCHRNECS